MLLVFFIVIGLILLFCTLIVLSTLQIKIDTIEISNENSQKKIKYNYQIILQLYLVEKIKWISIKINPERVEKLKLKQKLEEIHIQQLEKKLFSKEERKKLLEALQLQLKEFHLNILIGTKDVILTSAIIAVVSSILGILLAKVIKEYKEEEYHYRIQPIYQNTNIINLTFHCIIQVKMVHIIKCIYVLLRKRRVEKHERTSNRRSYDYGYE